MSFITFALYPIVNGQCACGNSECDRAGKHPAERWKDIPSDRPELVPTDVQGVGIATGARSGMFAVDLDVKNGVNGFAELAKLGDVPPTYAVATPTGGAHVYFKHPGFVVRNSAPKSNPIAPGVDIRGDGGYVVAAGSPHKNGGRYAVAADLPIADAPAWLLAWPGLKHAGSTTAEPATDVEERFASVPRAWRIARARAWLERQAPAVAGQGGDARTWAVLTRIVHDCALTNPEMITDAFAEWNARCSPPWRGQEWAHKVDSVLHKSTVPWNANLSIEHALETRGGTAPTEQPCASGPFPLTDSGNAERFAAQHAGSVRFVAGWNSWLAWDGTRWQIDKTGSVALLAKQTARSIGREAEGEDDDERRKKIRAWATKSEARQGRENMIALARSEHGIAAAPTDFDADPWLLNVANGTLDLRTRTLAPHKRADMITKLAPVAYEPNAAAPRWEAFLTRVMASNTALVSYLQRLAGYALTGSIREQMFAFSYGEGQNGKGVFHHTLNRVLGDYAVTAADHLFFVSKGDGGHPTSMASLAGARFVLCSEIPEDKRFNEQLLKNVTGGDAIKTRRLYENEWEFTPTFKLFFCGNHKPVIRGLDWAIWRRVRLVPWTVVIPKEEVDPELETKLADELPGILAWAVRGCAEWLEHGLGDPPDVEQATAGYREESDPMADFFRTRCEFGDGFKVARSALRRSYEGWCQEHGATALGARKVAEALRRRQVTDGGSLWDNGIAVDAWSGVRLADRSHVAA